MNKQAKTKMDCAVRRIIVREVFFASILMGLERVESEAVPMMATNGKAIFYNPQWVLGLDEEELIGVLCHEVEHVARLHPWRRQGRDLRQWNIATDYVINADLTKCKIALPKCALLNAAFDGMAEEQVYRELGDNDGDQPQPTNPDPDGDKSDDDDGDNDGDGGKPDDGDGDNDGDGDEDGDGDGQGKGQGEGDGDSDGSGSGEGEGEGDGEGSGEGDGTGTGKGSGKGQQQPVDPSDFGSVEDCPGDEAEQTEAEERMKVEIIRAAIVAKAQGRLPGFASQLVEEIKHPPVDWRETLRDFMTSFARDDYSWTRPNRRYIETGFCMPSLRNARCGTIVLAWDTSGSIGSTEIENFSGVLRDILETVKPERIIWVQCDAAIGHYQIIEQWDALPDELPTTGGGGTSFVPVFERIESENETPECMIYLTDGYGTFPDIAPSYPVLWAMTSSVTPPFGTTIKIEL